MPLESKVQSGDVGENSVIQIFLSGQALWSCAMRDMASGMLAL